MHPVLYMPAPVLVLVLHDNVVLLCGTGWYNWSFSPAGVVWECLTYDATQ
jgi:hypothetical protein